MPWGEAIARSAAREVDASWCECRASKQKRSLSPFRSSGEKLWNRPCRRLASERRCRRCLFTLLLRRALARCGENVHALDFIGVEHDAEGRLDAKQAGLMQRGAIHRLNAILHRDDSVVADAG